MLTVLALVGDLVRQIPGAMIHLQGQPPKNAPGGEFSLDTVSTTRTTNADRFKSARSAQRSPRLHPRQPSTTPPTFQRSMAVSIPKKTCVHRFATRRTPACAKPPSGWPLELDVLTANSHLRPFNNGDNDCCESRLFSQHGAGGTRQRAD